MSDQIRQQVTDRILKALSQGLVPWRKSWVGHKNDGPPINVSTSLPFRGVNLLLLQMAEFQSKWWATERCWRAIDFQVKPHQEGTQVVTGKADNLQSQTVFNAEQVEGFGVDRFLVRDKNGARFPDYEAADRVVAATGADIRHVAGNEAAYYRLPNDYIILPLKSQFVYGPGGLPGYYGTVAHELTHWSEHRLGWLADPHLTIKQRYAIGELRSEIGSAFLAAEIGIPFPADMTNHSRFVGKWVSLMRVDNTLIIRVASAASEAVQFILSFSRKQNAVAQTA